MSIMYILHFLCFKNDSLIADSFLEYPKILFTAIQLISETMLNKIHIARELTLNQELSLNRYHQLIISADIVAVNYPTQDSLLTC